MPLKEVYRALLKGVEIFWEKTHTRQGHAWFLGEGLLPQALKQSGWIQYNYKPRPLGLYPPQPLICFVNPQNPEARIVQEGAAWRFSMGDVDCM